jgi:hypothetical protein
MGFPVFSVAVGHGLTSSMNRAWKYFTSFDALQALFIMNNDILVAPGAFKKLHRCLMRQPPGGAWERPPCLCSGLFVRLQWLHCLPWQGGGGGGEGGGGASAGCGYLSVGLQGC